MLLWTAYLHVHVVACHDVQTVVIKLYFNMVKHQAWQYPQDGQRFCCFSSLVWLAFYWYCKEILDVDLSCCLLGDRMGQYHSGQEVYSNSVRVFDTGMYVKYLHTVDSKGIHPLLPHKNYWKFSGGRYKSRNIYDGEKVFVKLAHQRVSFSSKWNQEICDKYKVKTSPHSPTQAHIPFIQ